MRRKAIVEKLLALSLGKVWPGKTVKVETSAAIFDRQQLQHRLGISWNKLGVHVVSKFNGSVFRIFFGAFPNREAFEVAEEGQGLSACSLQIQRIRGG